MGFEHHSLYASSKGSLSKLRNVRTEQLLHAHHYTYSRERYSFHKSKSMDIADGGKVRILEWAFPHHLPLGGREIFTERLSLSLQALGHRVMLLGDSLHEDSPLHTVEELSREVEIHRLKLNDFGKRKSIVDSPLNLRGEIKRVIDEFNPDVIHYHNFYSKSLVFLSAYIRSCPRRIPVAYTLHDIETLSKIPPALGGEVIGNLTDVIVSPSQYIHKRFTSIDSFATKRAEVIYNGVPSVEENKRADVLQVIAAASFENHKGLVILLTAWEKIHAQFPKVQLILAGDGRDREFLINYANKLGVASSVRFSGWLSAEQLREEFGKDSVVVVPSLIAEAFGLVAAEAQMAGLPVIASDIGGLKEVISHDITGLLVPAGSASSLADALNKLLSSQSLRKSLGSAGRTRAREMFDMKDCTKNYELLFENLVS